MASVSEVPPGSSKTVACRKNRSAAEMDCPEGSPRGARRRPLKSETMTVLRRTAP